MEPGRGTSLEYKQMSSNWETAYQDERNKLIDGEQECSKSYDKYVLTLSGGALALSVTFIHDIIGEGPARASAFIVWAWISLTLSVAATLVSIHQSGPLHRDFWVILDRKAQHAGDEFSWTEVRSEQLKCRRLMLMDALHYASLVLFLFGVILLLLFTRFNLTGVTSMTDKTQPEITRVTHGKKPAEAAVYGDPIPIPPDPERGAKPPLAPVDTAPLSQPPPPKPSSPAPPPSQPSGGKG